MLAKALDRGGIHEIFGVLSLSWSDWSEGHPIDDDWIQVTRKQGFDEFISSNACTSASTDMDNNIALPSTPSDAIIEKKAFDEFQVR